MNSNPSHPEYPPIQIMIDLETLGQSPGSVIATIGAVSFRNGHILSRFYCRIDLQSCIDIGLKTDTSTLLWWMDQSPAARYEITCPDQRVPITTALIELAAWIDDPDAAIWGNGSDFDNTLLAAAYGAAKIPLPWKYYNNRCYRTLKKLHPEIRLDRTGFTHHNALADAEVQALHLIHIFNQSQPCKIA